MLKYSRHTLDNGLRLLIHSDKSHPTACISVLYGVGSRDEDPAFTGLAHLLEHMMFGGSNRVSDFDSTLQRIGGDSNAFTTQDITNYHMELPSCNLETGLWLESDRLTRAGLTKNTFEIQRKVVMEEFVQHYLNVPYGDAYLRLAELSYTRHPYGWMTIGKDIDHIERITHAHVLEFYKRFYHPGNAILVVSGDVDEAEVKDMVEYWFGPIRAGHIPPYASWEKEPEQMERRHENMRGSVPQAAVYVSFHSGNYVSDTYPALTLLRDILSEGRASLLASNLIHRNPIFSDLSCAVSQSSDPGQFIIQGMLNEGVEPDRGMEALTTQLESVIREPVSSEDLERVKTMWQTSHAFEQISLMGRTLDLTFFEYLGDPGLIEKRPRDIEEVTRADIMRAAREVFTFPSTIYYYPH